MAEMPLLEAPPVGLDVVVDVCDTRELRVVFIPLPPGVVVSTPVRVDPSSVQRSPHLVLYTQDNDWADVSNLGHVPADGRRQRYDV